MINVKLMAKGFVMGVADIIPGVSGGTLALILNIYDELIKSLSSVDKTFLRLLLARRIKDAFHHVNAAFLLPLLVGIVGAILLLSRFIHFLLNEHALYTWSLFFGLITASVVYLVKNVTGKRGARYWLTVAAGSVVGALIVSIVPTQTPATYPFFFLSGAIAICAMILPGISGSFILLILGKYAQVTGALKNPFYEDNLAMILVFCSGCLVGILSFSKLLNYLLKRFHFVMIAFLTGFIIGSLKKVWPWREVLETQMIRGKTHVLSDTLTLPHALDSQTILAFAIMGVGFSVVLGLEWMTSKSRGD